MYIGISLVLIALGAVLTFATDLRVSGLDLDIIGIILMLVGLAGLVISLVLLAPWRRSVSRTIATPPAYRESIVREDDVY